MTSLKIVLVGDNSVGKTCLGLEISEEGQFLKYSKEGKIPTVFDNFNIDVNHNEKITKLSFWDTRSDIYDSFRPLLYPGTDVVIICFDILKSQSFENIKNIWFPELQHHCPKVPILLVSTKEDLRANGGIMVSVEEAISLKKKIGAFQYLQTSSKTHMNIDELKSILVSKGNPVKNKSNCVMM
jgi:Ras-related C3 botulinum toxin substrate 1